MEGFYYDYDSDGGESWDHTPVIFLRPDGDTEGKDVQWCLDNDFFQVEEGYWSGEWYYRNHPEEKRLHPQRLKQTQDIRQRGEQRRSRIRAQRHIGPNHRLQELQEAALLSTLMGDIARQQNISLDELYGGVEDLNGLLRAPISGASLGAPSFRGSSHGVPESGSSFASHFDYYAAQSRQTYLSKAGSSRSKSRKNNPQYARGSEEAKEVGKEKTLENVIHWAEGDQGVVDRARAALKETNTCAFKCPSKGCQSHFQSQEIADLHAKNANGKAHDSYRKAVGLPAISKRTNLSKDYSNYRRCAACCLDFPSQELADFHLKNEPRHWRYRIENDMAQVWDLEDRPERFACPVCQLWFLTPEKMEEHVRTQPGKAHNRYRKQNEEKA